MGLFSFLFGKKKKKDESPKEQEALNQQEVAGSADDAPIADELDIKNTQAEQGDNEAVFGEDAQGDKDTAHADIAEQVEVAEKKENCCDASKKSQESDEDTSGVAAEQEQAQQDKTTEQPALDMDYVRRAQEQLAAEKAEQERLATEKAEQERIAAEKAEQERIAAEKAEQERLATEKAEQERIAAEKAEQERLAAEKAEQERLAAEKAEQERLATEKAEQERLAAEKAAREAEEARIAAEKAEQERIAAEKAEQERLAAEKAAREAEEARVAAEKAEQERIAAEKAEQERLAAEKAAREAEEARIAAEKAEQERIAAEKAEQERLAAEKIAHEAEEARIAAEKAEQERIAAEEQARLAAEQAAKAEQERLAAEEAAKAEAEEQATKDKPEVTEAPAEKAETGSARNKRYFFDVIAEDGEVLASRISYEKAMQFITDRAGKKGKILSSNNVSRAQPKSKTKGLDLQASISTRRGNLVKGVYSEEVIDYKTPEGIFSVTVRFSADEGQQAPRESGAEKAQDQVEGAEGVVEASETAETTEATEETAVAEAEAPKKMSFFARLKRTRDTLAAGLSVLVLGRKIDEDLYEELEDALLQADLGVETTTYVIDRLRNESKAVDLKDASALRKNLHKILCEIVSKCEQPLEITNQDGPFVILMVGVNGAGKTTTIGKLAQKFLDQGKSVMLAAGDTFRAAAVEQLKAWGERVNVPVVAQATGSDSASVIFDAVKSAKARNVDVLICDTAGRLQNKENLMEELSKIVRVMKKLDPAVPHETLLVLDGATGQNAVSQTKIFTATVPVTGLVLTKLDGTAKGGVVFALADQFKLPIRFIGVGEKAEDLRVFQAEPFVDALLSTDE